MSDYSANETLSELLKIVDETDTIPTIEPTPEQTIVPQLNKDDEILEVGESFDINEFQVVRREFFAHMNEPAVSFNNYKFYVNSACLQKFPTVNSVQVLVNQDTKILALMPCPDGEQGAFVWAGNTKGKRKPRQVSCPIFFAMICSLMNWSPVHRYKMLGKLIHANGEYLVAFDLTASEVYERTQEKGQKPKSSRKPTFPAEWKNQFGLPFGEFQQSMCINTFEGYAVYSVQEKPANPAPEEKAEVNA